MKKTIALVLILGAILAATLLGVVPGFDGSSMSVHGWIALGLGTFLSLALAAGLMALVFYSARRGYDDQVPPDKAE